MFKNPKQAGDEHEDVFGTKKRRIEAIAAQFGTAPEEVAYGYCSMLKKLAVDIYSKADHFVLELIQNADDVGFAALRAPHVPYIAFAANDDSVDVSCNEDGFSEENVKALCSVDRSTKTATSAIGKKGIGFKSVFKVCDKVQIGSNGYQFEFDKKDGPFGMVKPRWSRFPKWLDNQGEAIMRLTFSNGEASENIYRDLEDLEPSVLLFLRKIEEICIYTPNFRKIMTCKGRGASSTIITTKTWYDDQEPTSEEVEYAMVEYIPADSTPKVVLAFPRPDDESDDESLETQQIYNFLPIRDYGFKFIIQADFRLTANREEIEKSCEWNLAIKHAVPAAFLSAVRRFNNSEHDSLMWIKFLPDPSTQKLFFSGTDIDDHLEDEKVLFSQTGSLMKPSHLIYVPQELRIRPDQPVPLRIHNRHAISIRYDHSDLKILERMGVEHLTTTTFVVAIKELGLAGWTGIYWHEDLAKILLRVNRNRLQDVPLIPVTSHQTPWMTAGELETKPVYFIDDLGDSRIPDGIKLRFVTTEATKSKYRRKLMERLGVKPFDEVAVCEAIQQVLKEDNPQISIEIAVSQTKYLFRHRHQFPEPNISFYRAHKQQSLFGGWPTLWAAGYELYFDDPREKHRISKILPPWFSHKQLHPIYLQEDPSVDMSNWMDWLIEQQLAVVPRAIGRTWLIPQMCSDDFRYFARKVDAAGLCEVLVRHWDYYRSYQAVISELVKERLNQRFLRTKVISSEAHRLGMPSSWDQFLDIELLGHEDRYDELTCFGLITRLTTNPATRWLKLHECFWSDLDCIQFNSGLSSLYGDCHKLFYSILQSPSVATIDHLIDDLDQLSGTRNVNLVRKYVKPIMFRLAELLRRSKQDGISNIFGLPSTDSRLRKLKMYPIVAAGEVPVLVSDQEFTSDNVFFIPDRADLYELFKNKVKLLDFSPSDVNNIRPLIERFASPRLLSTEVRKSLSHTGKKKLRQALTNDYRQKHECILRCIRHYFAPGDAEVDGGLHQKLKKVKVYEVENVNRVLWLERTTPRKSSVHSACDLPVPKDALAIVRTTGDVLLRQDDKRFIIEITSDKSQRRKAFCHSVPELLVAELRLPAEAKGLIAPIMELDSSQSLSVLDEKGVARLRDTQFTSSNAQRRRE
ncbi:MAG: hypothetical protein Q9216_006601 [Gyalolechia sp. 2 TL-2023]